MYMVCRPLLLPVSDSGVVRAYGYELDMHLAHTAQAVINNSMRFAVDNKIITSNQAVPVVLHQGIAKVFANQDEPMPTMPTQLIIMQLSIMQIECI